jgi:site-specific DNA-methyltransferase (adenine-specific)
LVYNVLGEIDLDPCSNPGVPNVIAKNHYTLNTDGLKHPWKGVVFMNPPYGKTIKLWTNKLEEEYQNKNVTRAIALVPARVDTKWYQKIAKHTVCFLNGRIKFELNGVQSNPSIFPSVAIYLGTDDKLFIETFKTKGSIYRAVIP